MITNCSQRSDDHDLADDDDDDDDDDVENLVLENLDSYLDDIHSRLIVSRMVGNSVIKGMVRAIAEESAETISSKDAEIKELNRRLQVDDDGMMSDLSVDAGRHIQILKEEVKLMRRSNYLAEGTSLESLAQMDKSIDSLREIMVTVFRTRGETSSVVKSSLDEQLRQLTEGYETKLCEQRSLFDARYDYWLKKVEEISDLQRELEAVSKSMLAVELEHHHLYHHHHQLDDAFIDFKENIDETLPEDRNSSLLLHMSKEELISYYKAEISEIKRQLESSIHEKTEELFRVKRQLLKERGLLQMKREKEMEALKKRLPDICLRLDEVLLEARDFSSVQYNHEKTVSFKRRIDGLLTENRTLRDSLKGERNESSRLAKETKEVKAEAFIRIIVDECVYSSIVGGLIENAQKDLAAIISQKDKALEWAAQKEEQLKEALSSAMRNSEKLNREVLSLTKLVGEKVKRTEELSQEVAEKNNLILNAESKLGQQKEGLDRLAEECHRMKAQLQEQERLLVGCKAESDETMKMIRRSNAEKFDLSRKLALAEEERITLYDITRQKKNMFERSVDEFERIILRNLERRISQLQGLSYEFHELSKHVDLFKRRTSQQKEYLREEIEIILCNYERAENEVDQLGDEVDDLVSILEKVYIALDHYSPVLQHYTGVMEILEIVKRKLKEVNRQTQG